MNYQCAKVGDGLIKGFKLFVFLSRPLNISKEVLQGKSQCSR